MTDSRMLGMWDRDYELEMGNRFKAMEADETSDENDTLYPYEAFVIRVDGRAFHTFTRGMEKPFSTVLDECRNAAATAVLQSFKPAFAYHQSDEISYVWDQVKEPAIEHPFSGRKDKLLTLVASLTSTAFALKYAELTGDFSKLPHFDGRVAGRFSSRTAFEDAIQCVQWRENDAMRNSMQMYGQSLFSHKELNKKSVGDIYDMAKERGHDWFETAPEFRRGTYLTRGTVQKVIDEEQRLRIPEKHRPEAGSTVTRSAIIKHFFDDWATLPRVAVLSGEADE